MKMALNVAVWELLWKNRLVFAALIALLGLGGVMTFAAAHAAPDAYWLPRARSITMVSFLASMFLGFAPFSLMETPGGWRMNSMITRWYVLPVRTGLLVFVPLLIAALFIALLVAVWMPVLNRIAPGLDGVHFTGVLVLGIVAVHALAWTVPRKPSQFWIGAAVLLPVVLVLALGPQDEDLHRRRGVLIPLACITLLLVAFAWYAARRNRCGDWPGELPLDRPWQFLRQGGATSVRRRDFRSRTAALLWSDSLPAFRLTAFGWLSLNLVLFLYFSLVMQRERPELAFSSRLLAFIVIDLLPMIGLLWLAVWGIFSGCEPSAGFRTRLSDFRATLPITSGILAGHKLIILFLGWCLVWMPPLMLSNWYDVDVNGVAAPETAARLHLIMARFMAISAYLMVGALPLFLWGRLNGFPNLLLAAMCTWAFLWILLANLGTEGDPGRLWILVAALLVAKIVAAAAGLASSLRSGHLTWRFPVILFAGWSIIAAFLVWGLSTWQTDGPYAAATLVLCLPLARLAWCPFAIAANRQR
ncbi:MAG: hypothetical protein KJ072_05280 [Verrucomicrobia bacterium]|nr:hypothetical protein [Verrucomicrobiota bacterium]